MKMGGFCCVYIYVILHSADDISLSPTGFVGLHERRLTSESFAPRLARGIAATSSTVVVVENRCPSSYNIPYESD